MHFTHAHALVTTAHVCLIFHYDAVHSPQLSASFSSTSTNAVSVMALLFIYMLQINLSLTKTAFCSRLVA